MDILPHSGGSIMTKTNDQTNRHDDRNITTATALVADRELDITKDICPMTFVRTRLALDRLPSGGILLVHLKGDEPVRNVPRTAVEQGHEILSMTARGDGVTSLWLRKG
jgi:TusA-related sulfurtransferase